MFFMEDRDNTKPLLIPVCVQCPFAPPLPLSAAHTTMAKSIRSKIMKKHRAEFRERITKPYNLVREQQIQNKLARSRASQGGGDLHGDADGMEDEGDSESDSDESDEGCNAYGVPNKAEVIADVKPRFSFTTQMGVEGPTVIENRATLQLRHLGPSSEGRTVVHDIAQLEKVKIKKAKKSGMEVEAPKVLNTDYEFQSRPSTGSVLIHTTKTKKGSNFMIFHPEKRKGMHSTTNRNKR
jgi:hypothetical protein